MGTNHQLATLILTGLCSLLVNCGEQQLSYSSLPGAVDLQPDTFWGPQYAYYPPEIDGRPFDPTGGLGVQKFADQLIGKRIAKFVGQGWDTLRQGPNVNYFFTLAELGPGPGTCTVRRFQITSSFSRAKGREVKTSDGEWLGRVYAIAGSVAPMPEPWPKDYQTRMLQACRARSDMDMWYSGKPERAYLAARLADAIITVSKQSGKLPFDLRCTPFPDLEARKPLCNTDVRKSVASINPRAIIEVGDCFDASSSNCMAIQFPKKPERYNEIEDRWTLNVHFKNGGLQIQEVNVEDTQLIID